jgi:hypothetical protein
MAPYLKAAFADRRFQNFHGISLHPKRKAVDCKYFVQYDFQEISADGTGPCAKRFYTVKRGKRLSSRWKWRQWLNERLRLLLFDQNAVKTLMSFTLAKMGVLAG